MSRPPLSHTSVLGGCPSQEEGNEVVEIQLAETDRLDWALKQFRRRMIRSGMFKDMRRKRFYEKPSEARKAKAKAAERRRQKDRKRARAAARYDF